jgi:hypothetical protein
MKIEGLEDKDEDKKMKAKKDRTLNKYKLKKN